MTQSQLSLWADPPPPTWCAWFTGLIDGEGYFHLVHRNTGKLEVELVINLREDDGPVLLEIRRALNIGRIYHVDERAQRAKGERASDKVRWRCARITDIVGVLIPLFETYGLHSKKRHDYEIWREAAMIVYRRQHLSPAGRRTMLELVAKLKSRRRATPLAQRRQPVSHASPR